MIAHIKNNLAIYKNGKQFYKQRVSNWEGKSLY